MTQLKIPLDIAIKHISNNKDKERRQFNMSKEAVEQLEYIYQDMAKKDGHPYSAIVDKAIDTYFKLYKYVEELHKKKE